MDSGNKQRLIGVVVLIALATIALPVLFHHNNQDQLVLNLPQDAPPPPALPDVQIALPSASTPKTVIQHQTPDQTTTIAEKTAQISDQATQTTESTNALTATNTFKTESPAKDSTSTTATASANTTHKTAATTATSRTQKTTPTPTVQAAPKTTQVQTTASNNQKWFVQLGSFKNKANADKLLAHLRKNGFKAHSKTIARHTSTITKVYIGPEKNRASANWIIKKLNKTLHLKGILVRA